MWLLMEKLFKSALAKNHRLEYRKTLRNTMTKEQLIEFFSREDLNVQEGAVLIDTSFRELEIQNENMTIIQSRVPVYVGRAFRVVSSETSAFTYREEFAFDKSNYSSVMPRVNALPVSQSFKIDGVTIIDDAGRKMTYQAVLKLFDECRREDLLGKLTSINYQQLVRPENPLITSPS